VANCPASVRTDEIMIAARNDFMANQGHSLFQKLVYRGFLSHKERLEKAQALLRFYEKTGTRGVLYGKVLRRALNRLIYYDSFLPSHLTKPARLVLDPVIRPAGISKFKVIYFLGCASNVFWSQTVISSISYLVSCGVEVHLPPTSCCGEPHRSCGDLEESRNLALKNSKLVFQDGFHFIVTDCSTCARALHRYDEFVDPDSREAERLRSHLKKVVDLNTLVREHLGIQREKLKPVGYKRVTYHDPCHAVRGLGIKEAPRAILNSIPDLELVELDGADSCCGGAGSYGFTHPEMSGSLASDKALKINRTGADLLSTSCPACALQLGAGLKRAALSRPVLHPLELLAKSAGLRESV
jgi:glycolate oxidase iron-sulfur subunit